MDFNKYQKETKETWISTGESSDLARLALGVCDGAGAVACKVKKAFRKDSVPLDTLKKDLTKELGDVLYYVARLAAHYDINLNDVANNNLDKLIDRKERGVLKGSGDYR